MFLSLVPLSVFAPVGHSFVLSWRPAHVEKQLLASMPLQLGYACLSSSEAGKHALEGRWQKNFMVRINQRAGQRVLGSTFGCYA